MSSREIHHPSEELGTVEKIMHAARVAGDSILRNSPRYLSRTYIPPIETDYSRVRQQIKELENIANDPPEHQKSI